MTVEDFATLIGLVDVPFTAGLLVAVVALWRRLNTLTDAWLSYLEKRAQGGDMAAQRALESRTDIHLIERNGSAK